MFVVCKFPDENSVKFVLFDKTDFNTDDFNLIKDKEISLEELQSDYANIPILSLNDYLLRSISRSRTTSHKLGELNLDSYEQLEYEYNLIVNKQSKLSKSQRDLVELRYNEIQYV